MRTITIFDPYSRIADMQSDPDAGPGLQSAIGYLATWGMKPGEENVEFWTNMYADYWEIIATYTRPDRDQVFTLGAIFRRNRPQAEWEFHS